jgi:hypothetical protein
MRRWVVLAALALALGAPAADAQEAKKGEAGREAYSFYGLRFGMTVDEVRAVVKTGERGTEALKPEHGMMHLVMAYDYRGRLAEIRASWERPAEPQREEGLRRAINEKFVAPAAARSREVSATIDEFSNRSALTLVLVALDLREEGLNHFKAEYLKQLE